MNLVDYGFSSIIVLTVPKDYNNAWNDPFDTDKIILLMTVNKTIISKIKEMHKPLDTIFNSITSEEIRLLLKKRKKGDKNLTVLKLLVDKNLLKALGG